MNILKAGGQTLIAIGLLLIECPMLYYWALHPELSQMQLVIELWQTNVIGSLVAVVGLVLYNR